MMENNNKSVKFGMYCRVSTADKQDINNQIEFLKEYSTRNNITVAQQFIDIGQSGSKDSRPSFDKLLVAVRSGSIKGILCYKLDRIGRSLPHLVKLFEEFKKKNISFVSATQNINTSTAEGRMFLNMLMVFAEYERALTVSRVNDGLKRARKKGKRLGRPPGKKDSKVRRKSGYYRRWSKTS